MASLLTNTSALNALQSLTQVQKDLATTQNRISTGLRVSEASDNAVYWSIATTMKSDASAMSVVKDSLNLGASTVDVATAALNSSIGVLNQLKTDLVAAATPGADRTKIQLDVKQLQQQLKSIADSASFNGQNWLSADSSAATYNAVKGVVASFSRDATGVHIGTIDVDTTNVKLYDATNVATDKGILDKVDATTNVSINSIDVSALTDSSADVTKLRDITSQVDGALKAITDAASTLGATKTRIKLQASFVSALQDAITKGVGSLVDADMNEESTRLQALQVQQQLGVQSLGIANQNSQLILKLFNG